MPRLNELRLQRGRLLERITTQRYILIAEVQPVRGTLQRTDKLLATLRRATTYVQQHPLEVGLATAVLFAFNIRRTLRLRKHRPPPVRRTRASDAAVAPVHKGKHAFPANIFSKPACPCQPMKVPLQ